MRGRRPTAAAAHAVRAASPGRPLDGITVVELATIIAAPLSTTMLADLGARVIKLEAIDGDPYRHLIAGGTPGGQDQRRQGVDLRRPQEGRGPAHRPRAGRDGRRASCSTPGPAWPSASGSARRSCGPTTPTSCGCRSPATGATAPAPSARRRTRAPARRPAAPASRPAGRSTAPCDTLADVREISRQLMRANESNPDPNSSAVAASAILMALLARERFGIGQAVYVNMLAANMYANADDALAYAGKPARPACDDELIGFGAGYRLYRAADGWVFLAVTTDDEWRRCCAVDRAARARRRPPLRHRRRPGRQRRRAGGRAGRRASAGAPATSGRRASWPPAWPACRPTAPTPGPFFAHDPQMLANDFAPECTHPRFGAHRRWGPVVRVNGGLDAYGPGVLAGEHTDVLLAALGRSRGGDRRTAGGARGGVGAGRLGVNPPRAGAAVRRSADGPGSPGRSGPGRTRGIRPRYIRPLARRARRAAVARDGRAGDEAGRRRGQEHGQGGDVLGLAQPGDGRARFT